MRKVALSIKSLNATSYALEREKSLGRLMSLKNVAARTVIQMAPRREQGERR